LPKTFLRQSFELQPFAYICRRLGPYAFDVLQIITISKGRPPAALPAEIFAVRHYCPCPRNTYSGQPYQTCYRCIVRIYPALEHDFARRRRVKSRAKSNKVRYETQREQNAREYTNNKRKRLNPLLRGIRLLDKPICYHIVWLMSYCVTPSSHGPRVAIYSPTENSIVQFLQGLE